MLSESESANLGTVHANMVWVSLLLSILTFTPLRSLDNIPVTALRLFRYQELSLAQISM